MQLRRALPADAQAIADLHRTVRSTCLPFLPDLHSPDSVVRYFANVVLPKSEVWLAEDTELLGFIAFRRDMVDHLYVRADAHGRGIGSTLLELATRDGAARHLWTFQRNRQAQRFYLARGWRPELHTDGSGNEEGEPDTRFAWPPAPTESLALVTPSPEHVPAFRSALLSGWSPSTTRDISASQLAEMDADQAKWLRGLAHAEGTLTLDDGRVVERLPGGTFWMWDGAFCGSINLRHVPGSEELPDHTSGHIGYSVVPWKRRRGYATRALGMVLEKAAALGLRHVILTCDEDNIGSRAVIEGNGGTLKATKPHETRPGAVKLQFAIATRR